MRGGRERDTCTLLLAFRLCFMVDIANIHVDVDLCAQFASAAFGIVHGVDCFFSATTPVSLSDIGRYCKARTGYLVA